LIKQEPDAKIQVITTSIKHPTIRPIIEEDGFPLLSALLELLLKEENGFRRLEEGEERIESMILVLLLVG
jgi:hypothetical protein